MPCIDLYKDSRNPGFFPSRVGRLVVVVESGDVSVTTTISRRACESAYTIASSFATSMINSSSDSSKRTPFSAKSSSASSRRAALSFARTDGVSRPSSERERTLSLVDDGCIAPTDIARAARKTARRMPHIETRTMGFKISRETYMKHLVYPSCSKRAV